MYKQYNHPFGRTVHVYSLRFDTRWVKLAVWFIQLQQCSSQSVSLSALYKVLPSSLTKVSHPAKVYQNSTCWSFYLCAEMIAGLQFISIYLNLLCLSLKLSLYWEYFQILMSNIFGMNCRMDVYWRSLKICYETGTFLSDCKTCFALPTGHLQGSSDIKLWRGTTM